MTPAEDDGKPMLRGAGDNLLKNFKKSPKLFQKYLIDTSFLAYYIIEEGTENIRLTMQEVMTIRWHMGFSEAKENYNAVGQAMEKYPVVLALHEADLEATKILEVDS